VTDEDDDREGARPRSQPAAIAGSIDSSNPRRDAGVLKASRREPSASTTVAEPIIALAPQPRDHIGRFAVLHEIASRATTSSIARSRSSCCTPARAVIARPTAA
jgi:hypothetical protein